MAKTRVSCPNCRQPVLAEIEQLFDVGADPAAKQRFLSGQSNLIQCPACGYQGALATPLVYHDPEKELLLTFVPPEMGLPRDEQERLLGGLINQAVNRLPQEKRKAYLLRPQSVLTMQGMLERVLEGDGITREMIQAQQQRLRLIERLLDASPEEMDKIVKEEKELLDSDFFSLLGRLASAAAASGDQQSAQHLANLQNKLLPQTEFGRQVEEQSREIEAAMQSLRAEGRNLTRERLLELVIAAPNDTRLSALVSMARPGMDYAFFQLLTERIEKARPDEQPRLAALREKILQLTREIDQQLEARRQHAARNLETLLQARDLEQATLQNLGALDEFFMDALSEALSQARQKGDLERSARLNQVMEIIQRASAPPELGLIEELLEAPDEASLQMKLDEHKESITPELLDMLTNILAQSQQGQEAEMLERVQRVYRLALRRSMQTRMKEG